MSKIANHEFRGVDCPCCPANKGIDTGEELCKGKGFREIIITSRLKALYPIIDRAFRAENHDRNLRLLTSRALR